MDIQWNHSGSVSVAVLAGRMDAVSAQMFEQQVSQLTNKAVRVVLDLTHLEYISSMGLRSILATAKKLQVSGGGLCLCGARGLVKDILECSNFHALFPIFQTAAEAMA